MRLIVLTGASGSGKTAIANAFQARYSDRASVLFFDSIGVPSRDQMIAEFGSPEEWQRAKTIQWVSRIAAQAASQRCILLEGQARLSFLTEAVTLARLRDHRIILVDCSDDVRVRRLIDQMQPDLANPEMLT